MQLSSDAVIFWSHGWANLNLTIVTTWVLMVVLVGGSWLLTRRLAQQDRHTRLQALLEMIIIAMVDLLKDAGLKPARHYLPLIGTLFIFIALSNLLVIIPGYQAPTGSLSTTTALAVIVFVAVPYYGIRSQGVRDYLASYLKPVWIMLPFNLIGELSRTLALAVRLFGNMMSGAMIGAILLMIAPLIFPLLMNLLGLLTGMVQAYIFSVLAIVYIAAAIRIHPQ
ncbi:F0F1 ATP synthase subunit A [Desulfuromonas acetoxidans]|uniref:F0F1 ATP synthase subunit A n=1 Tax=Desulfuromonas acetoxidans TaxID=891 RepID=UPI00292F84FF|nr:F0F1 ATP synthase subunit A [Desulfuromonas acetoxidans]